MAPAVRPRDKFKVGDYIEVQNIYSKASKHAGQKATIKRVGLLSKLTVRFDDPQHKGSYVDYRDAVKVGRQEVPSSISPEHAENAEVNDIGELLTQLSITTAIAIGNIGGTSTERKKISRSVKRQIDAYLDKLE